MAADDLAALGPGTAPTGTVPRPTIGRGLFGVSFALVLLAASLAIWQRRRQADID
jgi:hypothetical protein